MDDWILAMQSWGIPLERISQISSLPVPGDIYKEIDLRIQRLTKAPEAVLYSTVHLPETENLYYKDHSLYEFEAKVVDVFMNLLENQKKNILILDRSAIYPTSGGQ
jgi:alanyl-tRNA synthetase